MVGLIKDGRRDFKSLEQMGLSQLSSNPELWIVPFKGKEVLGAKDKLKKASFKSSTVYHWHLGGTALKGV